MTRIEDMDSDTLEKHWNEARVLDAIQDKYVVMPFGCWEWQGKTEQRSGKGRHGLPCVTINGRQLRPHQASYWAYVADIPKGLVISHLCGNQRCINPDHLECVTQAENNLRTLRCDCGFSKHQNPLDQGIFSFCDKTARRLGDGSTAVPRFARRSDSLRVLPADPS